MAASTKSQTTATSKSSKKVPMAQQPQTKLTGWKLWVGLVLLLIGGLGLFMGQSALWISSTIFNQKTFVETTNKVPPMIASLISIIEARNIVAALTNAYLAPFMGQMWTMLVIAGAVALALSLRNYAKRTATRAINSFDNAKAK